MKKKWLLLCNIAYIIFLTSNAHPDLIESYNIINKNRIVVKANQLFSQKFIKEDFFAEYDESIDLTMLDESLVTIPFILSIIPVVWLCNKNYSIDVMDKDLYHSLQEVKKVFHIFYPEQEWAGELVPKKLVTNTIIPSTLPDKPAFGLLFSGGLDCVDSSISYSDTKQLLITVWGSDVKVADRDNWDRVLEQCRKFSQTYGHDHMFVGSNFREFIKTSYLYKQIPRWWLHVSHGLPLIGLSAPLLILNNISTLLIASTHTAKHPYPLASHPAIDNNILFAGSNVFYDGDKDRVQKIKNIDAVCKEKKLPLPHLRVCFLDKLGGNCLGCEKCLRTCISIIAAGQWPREYGFMINIKEVLRGIRALLKKTKYLSPGEIHYWQGIVSHLNILDEQKTSLSPKKELGKLRNFLCSVNFEQYRNPRLQKSYYSKEKHALFTTLWEQNMKEIKI